MKILHVTDLHFNKKWFEWILEVQDDYDVVCITGDFLDSDKDDPKLILDQLVQDFRF